jgi:alginate O-acetyltransferase complex protein AlgI
MLFNSHYFIFIFLPITVLIYFFINCKNFVRTSKVWLIVASLFFYGWCNVIYLPLIFLSINFNFIISFFIINYKNNNKNLISKKKLLIIGIIINLFILFYFKYMNFFIDNINFILNSELDFFKIALPLAISFFTLQQIAYLVDCYEGLAMEESYLDYFIFVVFFPQLIAGPIVHHKQMMPQFVEINNKKINFNNIVLGIYVFTIGLFKKVIIADTFSEWAIMGFDSQVTLNFFESWITSLSYTFQLYFDFSGYTDMAIGIGLLFNIKLPDNFNSPYKATGLIDFWKRWHITLTQFITTYIYSPILRSFKTVTFHKAMLATLITFLVAGLWHGASWMFIIFGFLHGVGLVTNHYWQKHYKKILNINFNKYLAWFITFNYINIAFVFFRSKDFNIALNILCGMFGLNSSVNNNVLSSKFSFLMNLGNFSSYVNNDIYIFFWIFFCFLSVLFFTNSMELRKSFRLNYKSSILCGLMFVISVLSLNKISEFLYFNF